MKSQIFSLQFDAIYKTSHLQSFLLSYLLARFEIKERNEIWSACLNIPFNFEIAPELTDLGWIIQRVIECVTNTIVMSHSSSIDQQDIPSLISLPTPLNPIAFSIHELWILQYRTPRGIFLGEGSNLIKCYHRFLLSRAQLNNLQGRVLSRQCPFKNSINYY